MKRGHGGVRLHRVVEKLRAKIPDLVFRSSFIVGHPGETEEDFEELCDFLRFAELDHVGVFLYSHEEGTASGDMTDLVAAKTARARHRRLLRVQRPISRKKLKKRVGTEIEVLVEGGSDESDFLLEGRFFGQAPDVDGKVFLANGTARPGEIRRARVTQAADYDLVADLLDEDGRSDAPPDTTVTPRRVKLRTLAG
jgi:ribosomal protein S12 methylthiotransferase